MAQILSKVLVAILTNVDLTIVASMANISKIAGVSPGSFQKISSLLFFS
jgi:hypothetical protein